ncbi:HNH endonuclease [Gordonia sp. DT30]|uniref:HNH endonuclease n=1 Tax=Gordonia sp. DT30 TaxID=3416546 RepID=UPI003CF58701
MMTKNWGQDAYEPGGTLWWEIETLPGQKRPFGDEPRIAAFLANNYEVGDVFTTTELRNAITRKGVKNSAEHFQRRIRQLRSVRDGWQLTGWQDDRTLGQEQYRIDKIGWHPGLGPRPKDDGVITDKVRAEVLKRDGSRCQMCGAGDGEPYPGEPHTTAKMTIGHLLPYARGGSARPGNLRVECQRCNEPRRAEGDNPDTPDEIWSLVRTLKTADLRRLSAWVAQGYRGRDKIDELYDRIRKLAPADRDDVVGRIGSALGGGATRQ